jgi:CspA family cold shock protein
MPSGRVKFFDNAKGFGFIAGDDGSEVFLHASVLPPEHASIKPGTRVKYGIAEGKRGPQAISLEVIEVPVVTNPNRKSAEDLAIITEDLIRLLDQLGGDLKRGKYPTSSHAKRVSALLRRVADDLEAY